MPLRYVFVILLASFLCSPLAKSQDVQIHILGIAQDAGVPQAGGTAEADNRAWQDPGMRRLATSLGVYDNNAKAFWMFDATPDFKWQLRHMQQLAPQAQLQGIFLTHGHIGHYAGLMFLGREVMGADAVPVYAMPRMTDFIKHNGPWSQLVSLNNIDLQPLVADKSVQLSNHVSVTPIQVPHRGEFTETVGYRIQGPNKRALFIPDIDHWQPWQHKLSDLVAEHDYLFIDATFYDDNELPGRDMSLIPHPRIKASMALLADLPLALKKRVHFIHLNHTNPALLSDSSAYKNVISQGFKLPAEFDQFEL